MTKAWPIGLLFFVCFWLTANFDSWVLWSIFFILTTALLILMFFIFKDGKFIGPSTLIDDFNEFSKNIMVNDNEAINKKKTNDDDDDEILDQDRKER